MQKMILNLCFYSCDFGDDCPDGKDERNCAQCYFETDQCGWVDVSEGKYIWGRENVTIFTDPLAPTVDGSNNQDG